jgi:hypothetical protein
MKQELNYKVIGLAGIAWSIVQLPLIMLFMFVTTPAMLISQGMGLFFRTTTGPYYISAIVLTAIIVFFTIGSYERKRTFVFLLFSSVILWMLVAIYGLIIKNRTVSSFAEFTPTGFIVTNVVYFGIMVVTLFVMSTGIWHQPPRKFRLPVISSAIFLLIIAPIALTVGVTKYNHSGSISGTIYQPDGAINAGEVHVYCQALEKGVVISQGDPTPPYLAVSATGNYKIENFPKSNYLLWVADRGRNLYSDGFTTVNVTLLHNSEVDFHLVPGGSISGRFLDSQGNTVAGAGGNKWIQINAIHGMWSYRIQVNPDGTYSEAELLPTDYYIYSNLIQWQPSYKISIESGNKRILTFR